MYIRKLMKSHALLGSHSHLQGDHLFVLSTMWHTYCDAHSLQWCAPTAMIVVTAITTLVAQRRMAPIPQRRLQLAVTNPSLSQIYHLHVTGMGVKATSNDASHTHTHIHIHNICTKHTYIYTRKAITFWFCQHIVTLTAYSGVLQQP